MPQNCSNRISAFAEILKNYKISKASGVACSLLMCWSMLTKFYLKPGIVERWADDPIVEAILKL